MTVTTIRTTCGGSQLAFDVPSTSLVLALPAAIANAAVEPSFVAICPGCSGASCPMLADEATV